MAKNDLTLLDSILDQYITNGTPSVGASGAIFGVIGALLYFGYHYRIFLGNVIKTQIIPLIVLNLAMGFVIANVDNFAHIGGLIGGILSTMALGVEGKSTKSEMINGWIITFIYLAFIIYLGFVYVA